MLNQDLRQQLSQDMALILLQPKGEPEFNMKDLQATWDSIMAPVTAAATSVETDESHPEVTDIRQCNKGIVTCRPDATLTSNPACQNARLLRHGVARNNRPTMLNNGACRQVPTFCGISGIATGQTYRQIPGAEGVSRSGRIDNLLFR